jgi:hypothetical protein
MFAPWLDPRFPKPAKEGELRWVVSGESDNDIWVDGPEDARMVGGRMIRATSRTYIHSSVKDNPWYAASDYERQLDAMRNYLAALDSRIDAWDADEEGPAPAGTVMNVIPGLGKKPVVAEPEAAPAETIDDILADPPAEKPKAKKAKAGAK